MISNAYFEMMRDAECTLCGLRKSAKSVCIGMERLHGTDGAATTCLVVVGEKPGVVEDAECGVFRGHAGEIARNAYVGYIVQETGGNEIPDVYGTNAVRCMPPVGSNVTATQAKKCSLRYLSAELDVLRKHYDRVVVLACGGPACHAVFGCALGKALRRQAEKIGDNTWGFATFNPAVLLPGRDPSLASVIRDHLKMLADWLQSGEIPTDLDVCEYRAPIKHVPMDLGDRVISIDIETYGAVAGLPEQTVFHPVKSCRVDGCDRKDLVQTVAVAWREQGGAVRTALYVMPEHLQSLRSFLLNVTDLGCALLGQNLCFDLMYLRAYDDVLRSLLDRDRFVKRRCELRDLLIANFLDNDMRPEKSLKEVAPLLRVYRYSDEKDLGSGFRYDDRWDPELHFYNCADAAATLECWDRFERRTRRRDPGTARFGKPCITWYSDLLWSCLELDEAGAKFDRGGLEALQAAAQKRVDKYAAYCEERWGLKISGKGSRDPVRDMIRRSAEEAGLVGDRRLEISKVTRIVSTGAENRNLLLNSLAVGSENRLKVRFLSAFKSQRDIIARYTRKYLGDAARGLCGDTAYPNWFVAPGYAHDAAGGAMGGTRQGRITCSNPGRLMEPPCIKRCAMSRWTPGVLISGDLSQIELRVMALLSGDPVMLAEYAAGIDRHLKTGLRILMGLRHAMVRDRKREQYGVKIEWLNELKERIDGGEEVERREPGIAAWRRLGKTVNFAKAYMAGPSQLQAAARRMNRIELDLNFCSDIIRWDAEAYPEFGKWQRSLIRDACRRKHVELPIIGDRRTFLGSEADIQGTYSPIIVNFPVQTLAARILQSAQRELQDGMRERRMKACITENCYDSLTVDAPGDEEAAATEMLAESLRGPPFYSLLQSEVGRTVPLDYEIKVLSRTKGNGDTRDG